MGNSPAVSVVRNSGLYDDSFTYLELRAETATHALAGASRAACAQNS